MGSLLRQLVLESLTQPKIAAKRLLGLDLPRDVVFQIAVIVAILQTVTGVLLLNTFQGVLPGEARPEVVRLAPILDALFQLSMLYFFAFFIEKIGQMFEGKGNYRQSLLVVIFLSFVTSLWFIVLTAALSLFPALAILVALTFVYWTFWALASFVVVLHGFKSVMSTLLGVIVFGMMISLILLVVSGIILNATGLMPTGAV